MPDLDTEKVASNETAAQTMLQDFRFVGFSDAEIRAKYELLKTMKPGDLALMAWPGQ